MTWRSRWCATRLARASSGSTICLTICWRRRSPLRRSSIRYPTLARYATRSTYFVPGSRNFVFGFCFFFSSIIPLYCSVDDDAHLENKHVNSPIKTTTNTATTTTTTTIERKHQVSIDVDVQLDASVARTIHLTKRNRLMSMFDMIKPRIAPALRVTKSLLFFRFDLSIDSILSIYLFWFRR